MSKATATDGSGWVLEQFWRQNFSGFFSNRCVHKRGKSDHSEALVLLQLNTSAEWNESERVCRVHGVLPKLMFIQMDGPSIQKYSPYKKQGHRDAERLTVWWRRPRAVVMRWTYKQSVKWDYFLDCRLHQPCAHLDSRHEILRMAGFSLNLKLFVVQSEETEKNVVLTGNQEFDFNAHEFKILTEHPKKLKSWERWTY